MIDIPRGTVYRVPWINIDLLIQILGGPVFICGEYFYTIRIIDASGSTGRIVKVGDTTLFPLLSLKRCLGVQPILPTQDPYRLIPYGTCAECAEDEMIFYEGDYICAWCREKLEEGF